jgi:myo-inositol 2-dehydrogenase / D-chiro-inositol 1-dehydrogenase
MSNHRNSTPDRRSFLKNTGLALIGTTLAYHSSVSAPLDNRKKPTLKVGLVGCGGRGTGAAMQALNADPDVILTAMGDVFEDRLNESYNELVKAGKEKVKVNNKNKFVGFDAYLKVIGSGVDVVLLATPPSFRPDHLTAAIDAGKHVFCEKPVAVDAPGIRKVLTAAKKAQEKKLSILSGFCYRYDLSNRTAMERILKGDLGDIRTVTTFRHGGELWTKPRQPDWSDMTYHMRNWYYYNWLSGDFIVEQAVHSIDLMCWAMGDQMPVKVTGTGGRQVRVDDIYGNIYDHFALEFEYKNGAKGYHFTRQQNGTSNRNSLEVMGTDGNALILPGRSHEITGKNAWKYTGPVNNMYQAEHDEFFASIRNGKPMNDGQWMANSTMMAIWARMAAYTGQTIGWEEAINSNETLGPKTEDYRWDLKWPVPPIAKPGITKFI